MQALMKKSIFTQDGEKTVSVHASDIRDLDIDVDIMTVSSFYRSYMPSRGTLFQALLSKGIDVNDLSGTPFIDLRDPCNVWLSREVSETAGLPIGRIGCIELSRYSTDRSAWKEREAAILSSVQAYFRMLDIASIMGVNVEHIVLPVIGTGTQGISADFIMTPMLNECIRFLKNNRCARHIMVITKNQEIAFRLGMMLERSYSFLNEASTVRALASSAEVNGTAFISYASKDKNIADNLCAKLEARGIKVWYAPRDIVAGDYAGAIVRAINSCTRFVVILSRNSLQSDHVLNEIDLAFGRLHEGIKFLPLKIDEEEMGPSFRYYLSRQHWMDAHLPPLERRLDEFVDFCL